MIDHKELINGFTTAYIDGTVVSGEAYRPTFVSNNHREGKKVISAIEDELLRCEEFKISVAFITNSGIEPLMQTLKELERKNIPGQVLTTNYLCFSEPKALERLNSLSNITLKMFDSESSGDGFHTKGYIFRDKEIYRIIIGSSNMTGGALKKNIEWNTRFVSTAHGEIVEDILGEYEELWNSKYAKKYNEFIEEYRERYSIIKNQRKVAQDGNTIVFDKYQLQPNNMQVGFITNLKKLVASGATRALLISATGTGKTYASAFAMRELGFKRVLFVAHRFFLIRQAKESFQRVFNNKVTMGIEGSGIHESSSDYVFAMVATMSKDDYLHQYRPDEFDCIILDECHRSTADTYRKIMDYFRPKLFLGMTATPDKRDDNEEGRNVYELYDHQIAYEIRLQQAMEDNLLCPFHYFGITDLNVIGDSNNKNIDFSLFSSDERIRHIVSQANYYGYSGDRVKGLIFCRYVEETELLSKKLNQIINPDTGKKYRTVALNGTSSEQDRKEAFERLAMDEDDGTDDKQPLDYILSRDILNEGVDIVEVNQVIMLRPTESPIVFIQQLGRGLRKANGKEFVVVLDFIGNYEKNFMIPVALSGDRTYNPDIIRKYVISGNNVIPGASTVHFDEIAKEKIFSSIDKIRGIKDIIKNSYVSMKNRLGRIPYLIDFYDNGEVDPLLIIKEYKTYNAFLEIVEKDTYKNSLTSQEMLSLEYLSKTILNGVRPYELEILSHLLKYNSVDYNKLNEEFCPKYGYTISWDDYNSAVDVLKGHFVSKKEELIKYQNIDILEKNDDGTLNRLRAFDYQLKHLEYCKHLDDIVTVGLRRYNDMYKISDDAKNRFALYEKYSRRDVSLIMNCGKDLSSTMYGKKLIGEDVFLFVTYNKEVSDNSLYLEGKPDYADEFGDDNVTFYWDSQIGKGVKSGYIADVVNARRKHLFVQKNSGEGNFYYMGQFEVIDIKADKKENNKGKKQDIAKLTMRMQHPVREDLLRYFKSNLNRYEEKKSS